MYLWSLAIAYSSWDIFAAAVGDGVVLWRVVFGDFDALVGGLGAVSGCGEVWLGGDGLKSRVIATFRVVSVLVVRFTAGAQILSLFGCFEIQFLRHGFEICDAEVESCEH